MTADDLPDPATPAAAGDHPEDPPPGATAPTPAPPPELLVAAKFDVAPGYQVHRDHGAPSWLVTWTIAGAGRVRQGDAEVAACPGDLVVLGPGLPHWYAVAPGEERWSFWWVHCPARAPWHGWLSAYDTGDRLYRVPAVPDHLHARIDGAFRSLHADARWSGQGPMPVPPAEQEVLPVVAAGTPARELALGRVEEVLVLATAAGGPAPAPAAPGLDPRVQHVEALVAADPAGPHSVRSLAAQVALSPSRLAHLFTAQTGRTPMQALRDARLRHAARLLEATDLTVGRVAAASGFVSAFHFSRLFSSRYGVPPKDYRAGRRE